MGRPGGAAVALCIARRESGLIPWAESADGMNKGLFQQHVRYWDANYDTYTRPVWRLRSTIINGRTNAIVSIRMAHRSAGTRGAAAAAPDLASNRAPRLGPHD